MFKDGREEVRDDYRFWSEGDVIIWELIRKICNFMDGDRCLSIKIISIQSGVGAATLLRIIHENLNMRQICWRLVHRILGDAKERLVDDSSVMVDGLYLQARSSCASGYLTRELDLRLWICYKIAQWKHPDSPRPGIACRSQINKDYFLMGLGSSGRCFVVKDQFSPTIPRSWQRLATKLSFIHSADQNLLHVIFCCSPR